MGCADCAMHKGPAVSGPLRGAYSGISFLLFCFATQKVVRSTEIYTILYTYLLNSCASVKRGWMTKLLTVVCKSVLIFFLVWNRRGPTIEALHKPPRPPKPCCATATTKRYTSGGGKQTCWNRVRASRVYIRRPATLRARWVLPRWEWRSGRTRGRPPGGPAHLAYLDYWRSQRHLSNGATTEATLLADATRSTAATLIRRPHRLRMNKKIKRNTSTNCHAWFSVSTV